VIHQTFPSIAKFTALVQPKSRRAAPRAPRDGNYRQPTKDECACLLADRSATSASWLNTTEGGKDRFIPLEAGGLIGVVADGFDAVAWAARSTPDFPEARRDVGRRAPNPAALPFPPPTRLGCSEMEDIPRRIGAQGGAP
jgi:hypothetical protein